MDKKKIIRVSLAGASNINLFRYCHTFFGCFEAEQSEYTQAGNGQKY